MGSSKQTIGYWFKYLFHYGWCRGPVDAVLEWRVGGRTAWAGRITESTRIAVDQLYLFGGDKGEGGVQTELDIMMGESDQAPNDYLAANLGPQQSGYRGKLTTVIRGGIMGAFNPYPKDSALKVERILADWPDGTPWYPEKAVIELGTIAVGYEDTGQRYRVEEAGITADYHAADYDDSGWAVGRGAFGNGSYGPAAPAINTYIESGYGRSIWVRNTVGYSPSDVQVEVRHDDGAQLWWNGEVVPLTYVFGDAFNTPKSIATIPAAMVRSSNVAVLKVTDSIPSGDPTAICAGLKLSTADAPLRAMNPAHMIYESIVMRPEDGGQGEPAGLINEASFAAAADRLYAEGFGLCTVWDGDETVEEFQDRICDVIGARLNQSREDGQYYLDLIRSDYDVDTLPILTEDDILDIAIEPRDMAEAVNQVQVGWFDPQAKENRVTQPVSSLGGIQAAGGIIPKTYNHREIPTEGIALRVAGRYLAVDGRPLSRYSLTTNRRAWKLRPGLFFRLQMPSEGIGDVVCLAGDVDYGELTNGRMKIIALLDVFALPDAVFVEPQGTVDTGSSETPVAPPQQRAFEIPYHALAGSMSTADLNVLAADAGYLGAVGTRPAGLALNYTLVTAAGSESLVDRGTGDWCPGAAIVEAAGPADTAFTMSGASDLDQVAVGSWALWGAETVRVDAIDASAGTVTLGRGCGDSVPVAHAAGERIFFAGEWTAADRREYVGGETVHARLLTRTPSALLAAGSAPDQAVVMDDRQIRPYPPGRLLLSGTLLTDASYPATLYGAVTAKWAYRDRLLQADQLVDTTAASVGPESGTTYTVSFEQPPGTVVSSQAGLTGTVAAPYSFPAPGTARIAVTANRGGYASWQALEHTFEWAAAPPAVRITETGDRRITESGDVRVTE